MADGSFPGLVSRNRDVNAAANGIYTHISDVGGDVVTVTGGKLDVNADVTVGSDHVFVDDTAFTVGTDHVASVGMLADETGPDSVNEGDIGIPRMTLDRKQLNVIVDASTDSRRLVIDANGSAKTTTAHSNGGTFGVVDSNFWPAGGIIDETTPGSYPEGGSGVLRMTADRKLLNVIVDATTDANRWTIDSDGQGKVGTTLDDGGTFGTISNDIFAAGFIVDEVSPGSLPEGAAGLARMTPERVLLNVIADDVDNDRRLTINSDGSINVVVNQNVSATEIHDYDTAAAVASDAVSNHDYTVTGATMLLKSVIVSGSGNIKFEVQTGPLASLATVAVGFLTGRQGDTKQLFFDPSIEVPVTTTGTVRVIRTNRQGSATDLYSTIIGNNI